MGRKHFGKKEKMLVTSIFSFSQNVSKSLLSQGEIFFQKPPFSGGDLFSKASFVRERSFFKSLHFFRDRFFFQKPPFSGRDLFFKSLLSQGEIFFISLLSQGYFFFFFPSKASFLRERSFFQKHPPQGEIFFISLLSQGDFFFFQKLLFSGRDFFSTFNVLLLRLQRRA